MAEATAAVGAALVRDPWNEPAYLEMGRILVRAGREGEGATFLERYRKSDPFRRAEQEALALETEGSDARALLSRAKMERERGRLFEAMELANRAISKDPRLGDAYLELARISIFVAKPRDAVPILERLGPDPRALLVLAEALEASGNDVRAAEARAAAAARGAAPAAAPGPSSPAEGTEPRAARPGKRRVRGSRTFRSRGPFRASSLWLRLSSRRTRRMRPAPWPSSFSGSPPSSGARSSRSWTPLTGRRTPSSGCGRSRPAGSRTSRSGSARKRCISVWIRPR
jgi:predicted Zn-dependent protease